MLIFDGDYPMAYGAIDLNRDLTLPLDEVRAADPASANVPIACLPEMRKGGVAEPPKAGSMGVGQLRCTA